MTDLLCRASPQLAKRHWTKRQRYASLSFCLAYCTNAVTAGLTQLSNSADIEREVLVLKREEQKLIREIKQTAAKGNTAGAKQLAKSLIRLRGQEAKLQASMGQLRGVKTSIAVCAISKPNPSKLTQYEQHFIHAADTPCLQH